MFGSAIKNLRDSAASMASRYKNKEFMEGIVAVGLMFAYADGELEAAEKSKLMKILEIKPELAAFSTMDKLKVFKAGNDVYEIDTDMGNEWALKQIDEGVAGDSEKARSIIIVGIAMAKADGEFEPAEQKVADMLCKRYGVTL